MKRYVVYESDLREMSDSDPLPTPTDTWCVVVRLDDESVANYQQELERLHSTLAYRLQELDNAKWLIRNGEKHFGSLWRDATAEDINAITRRALPQPAEHI